MNLMTTNTWSKEDPRCVIDNRCKILILLDNDPITATVEVEYGWYVCSKDVRLAYIGENDLWKDMWWVKLPEVVDI
jgi:hypothetical protein